MGYLTKEQVNFILEQARGARPRVYVETGTYHGQQLAVAAPLFARAIGVELNPEFVKASARAAPSAELICGDTREVLPRLARDIKEPALFYLDAHFCKTKPPISPSPFPLWDELIVLRARGYPDIVLVDDVHTFGKKRPELNYRGAPDWEGVTEASISSFLGASGFRAGDCYVVCRG